MKGFIVVILGIIVALLVVGGVAGYAVMSEASSDYGGMGNLIHKILDKVSNVETSDDGGSSVVSQVGDKVKEEVVESGQEPGLSYREVTYDDGGVRQYDINTGELIGSTYESDQDKLPSME